MFSLMCVCLKSNYDYNFLNACLQQASATRHTTDDSVLAYFW
jgi:hypothetical protein